MALDAGAGKLCISSYPSRLRITFTGELLHTNNENFELVVILSHVETVLLQPGLVQGWRRRKSVSFVKVVLVQVKRRRTLNV